MHASLARASGTRSNASIGTCDIWFGVSESRVKGWKPDGDPQMSYNP
jgi:hypothetical protein